MKQERILENNFPIVRWREPLQIHRGGETGYACRYCIALKGFGPNDELQSHGAVLAHIEQEHPA